MENLSGFPVIFEIAIHGKSVNFGRKIEEKHVHFTRSR